MLPPVAKVGSWMDITIEARTSKLRMPIDGSARMRRRMASLATRDEVDWRFTGLDPPEWLRVGVWVRQMSPVTGRGGRRSGR
ncbi:hypothetical protein GCM10027062_40070 [Nocardioides hungaricus]